MSDRHVAYTPIALPDGKFAVAIVEKDVGGYAIDPREPKLGSWDAARRRASDLNTLIGVDESFEWDIVVSSMTVSRKANQAWMPRGTEEKKSNV